MAVTLTGCAAVKDIVASTSDAWQVTYELSVDGDQVSTVTDISYLSKATRLEDQVSEVIGSVTLEPAEVWSIDTTAIVGEKMKISASPSDTQRVTCRIMLDETHEISSETGAPGKAVTCEGTAPQFEQ